jgi:hypothetical protein
MPAFLRPLDGSDPNEINLGTEVRAARASDEDVDFASQYATGLQRTPGSALGAFALGTTVDLADTVASALPGIERGQINQTFLGAIGNPGLTRFYEENKGGIEVASGIAGIVAADYLTRRLFRPASAAYKVMEALPFARKVAALDLQASKAIRVADMVAKESALRGAMGVERLATGELQFAALGAKPLVTTPGRAASNVFRTQVAKGLRHNLTTELIMGATLHNNSFLYSDDFAHNVAWGAAGLAIGGVFDRAVAAHTLRKIANSDAVRRINSVAFDVTGKEADRLGAFGRGSGLQSQGISSESYIFAGAGVFTDRVTSLAIQAGENQAVRGFTDRARALFGKREAIANQQFVQVFEEANKATVRGLQGLAKAGFVMDAKGARPGAYRMVKESLYRQPDYFWGIEEVGAKINDVSLTETHLLREQNLDENITRLSKHLELGGVEKTKTVTTNGKTETQKWIAKFKPEQIESMTKELAILRESKSRAALVSFEPGEWAPARFAEVLDGFEHGKPLKELDFGDEPLGIFSREAKDGRFGVSTNGDLYHPGKNLGELSTHQMLHMFAAGRDLLQHFASGGKGLFRVSENPNWFQLDLAVQVAKVTDDPLRVQLPKGMSLESAMVESLAQKVDALKKFEKFNAAQQARNMAGDLDSIAAFKLKLQLNLPRISSQQQALMEAGQHPYDLLLAGFKSGDQVRNTPYQSLLKALNESRMIHGFTDEVAPRLEDLSGNSFNFLKDRDGVDLEPLLGYRRPMNPNEWSQDSLALRQTMKAEFVRSTLLGEEASPLIREIGQLVTSDPNFIEAGKIAELADDQMRSFVPGFGGAAPQTGRGALMNAITSRERRDVDNLTMLAASRVRELVTRVTQGTMKRVIETHMGDVITRVNQPGNAASKLLLNQFHTFRQGWELLPRPKVLERGDGKEVVGFVLDHTNVMNQRRFQQMFGRELKKGDVLTNPEGKPIVADALALETLERLQAVHAESLRAKNTILRANGLPELKTVPWYAPPPNLKGKFVAYTFDELDNVVPGMTVIANTAEELGVLSRQLEKSEQWKTGYRLRQRSQITAFMDLWDKAQMDYIAPNVTAIQPNKRNYGLTGGNLLNPNAFDEALVTMRDNLIGHGDDLMATLFKEQIKSAESRARIAQLESAVGGETIRHSSVYSRYIENLTGKSALASQDTFFGKIQSGFVDAGNRLLAEFPDMKPGEVFGAMREYFKFASPTVSKANTQRFEKLSQALGPYMPYKSAMQMVERETGFKTPKEIADYTAALSWFEASSRLRWLESMHAVANMGGILSNAPAVIRALEPLAGETIQDTAKRTGNLVMNMVTPEGRNIPMLNIPKLMWKSMKQAWSKTPDEFTLKAERLGYMNQEVAEFNRTWGAIDSAEGVKGFAKKADYYAGWMSDKSEAFTRQWGMYMGREAAQALGIHNVDDQLAFAHDLTNKMIANYDPRNRPEVFQGALGAPLGLFQSYVINYYQRMFRYIETGNTRQLAIQGASQAAVFGIGSLPGWKQLNWAFFDQGQAETDDPVDSMYRRFGSDADWIMHGTLSNLPKLFGVDGVSLYTRGDSEVRLPSISAGPIADTVKRLVTGLGMAADGFANNPEGFISNQQLSEIMSNMITNRPLAGLIEVVGSGGYDTSPDGQVVSKQAFQSMNSIYRVMGVKGMMQQKQAEMFYANKTAEEEQAARRDSLITASRAAIRSGNVEALPAMFKKYTQEGGSATYFTRWVKDMVGSSLNTRTEQQLIKALKKPDENMNYIMRLIDSQVGIKDGELNTDDYGHEDMIDRIVEQGWDETPEPVDETIPTNPSGLPDY